ncbi:MAG: hypothetical protein ACFFD2_24490 [Promethearchaeota archaeon]
MKSYYKGKVDVGRDIQIFVLNKLRSSSIKVADWLLRSDWIPDMLLINLPQSTQEVLEEYGNGMISDQAFWMQWKELFDLSDPFINALRYRFHPLLQAIAYFYKKNPQIKVIPYEADYSFLTGECLKEQFMLLLYRARATQKIDLKGWKEVLYDEFQWNKSNQKKIEENVLINLQKQKSCANLCLGGSKALRDFLLKNGYSVRMRYFGSYWRDPLEVLSYLISLKGPQNISDPCIQACIKNHISYLDFILKENTIDAAHQRWAQQTFKIYSPDPL